MNIKVKKVTAIKNYKLYINFNFGINGIYDTKFLFDIDRFKTLKDEKAFNKVKIYDSGNGIIWNENLHICVEELFEGCIKAR